jgi:hypothetical protein
MDIALLERPSPRFLNFALLAKRAELIFEGAEETRIGATND